MALDAGPAAHSPSGPDSIGPDDLAAPPSPTLQSGGDIGQALRAMREHHGFTVEQIADRTRVRRVYLTAIEAMQLEKLPSRPFTIGYIRAYAEALGADGDEAVERFKAEEPVLDEPLRAPLGVGSERDPRVMAIALGLVITLAAIVLWNIAQRAMNESAPPSPTAPAQAAARVLDAQRRGPVVLGAPLPAPVESTTPPPYETPGLAQATADGVSHSAPAAVGARPAGEPPVDPESLPANFQPAGAVYGAPPQQPSLVTVQALKSASLIVKGANGSVYFARQLAAGEAYRAPQLAGLVIDVSEPESFQVFVAGQTHGFLPAAQTALSKLTE